MGDEMSKEDKVSDLLAKTNLMIFRYLSNRYREQGIEVTPVQAKIMMVLSERKNGLNQKQLEEVISCNKSTISSILNTMEKNGLIKRKEDDSDSRKKIIYLTDKSYNIISVLKKECNELDSIFMNIIGENDYVLFCDCLNKIYYNLKEKTE